MSDLKKNHLKDHYFIYSLTPLMHLMELSPYTLFSYASSILL